MDVVKEISAIVPVAGLGLRMEGQKIPKQFIDISGKTILRWTLSALASSGLIGEIIVVVSKIELKNAKEKYTSLPKVSAIVEGGDSRAKSVYNGVLASKAQTLLIHDGARPCVTAEVIRRVVDVAGLHGSATSAIETTDTLKIKEGSFLGGSVERSAILSIQTPQVFSREVLLGAYELAKEKGMDFNWTDETSLLKSFDIPVAWAEGDSSNIKVTRKEDINIARFFLENL